MLNYLVGAILKILIILFFMFAFSDAKVYYSKVDPYEIREISSNVSGVILFTNENLIGKKLTNKPYILIDSQLDREELKFIEEKLIYLKDIIAKNKTVLTNQEMALSKKRKNYKKIESLKIKSVVEKDREFYDLVNSENQFLNTQKEIQNLQVQIIDLKLRKAKLQRSVYDKTLRANGFTLYAIAVKPGQVVGISSPLAKVADISKAILTIYLDEQDVKGAKQKVVYIDGKKTLYKISRLIKPPKLFSKLVKIELKDE